MYKLGEYVVYRKEVCLLKDMQKENYILVPIDDESLKIKVPFKEGNKLLRGLVSKKEIESLIQKIPNINPIEIQDKTIENEYKNLFEEGSLESLIKIIKTTYLRNKKRTEEKKKVTEKDDFYFKKAEKYLYNECAIVLNMTYEEAKQYIIENVEKMLNNK